MPFHLSIHLEGPFTPLSIFVFVLDLVNVGLVTLLLVSSRVVRLGIVKRNYNPILLTAITASLAHLLIVRLTDGYSSAALSTINFVLLIVLFLMRNRAN